MKEKGQEGIVENTPLTAKLGGFRPYRLLIVSKHFGENEKIGLASSLLPF